MIHLSSRDGPSPPDPDPDHEAAARAFAARGDHVGAAYLLFVAACNRGEVRHTAEAWAEWQRASARGAVFTMLAGSLAGAK